MENTTHEDDLKTMSQILMLLKATRDDWGMLGDAYHLGRIRGRLEGVESALKTAEAQS